MSEMSPRFTFLFTPLEAVGHFNASIGIAQQLLSRGHKIVFATPNSWRGKLEPLGFIEEPTQDPQDDVDTEKWGAIVSAMKPALKLSAFEQMQTMQFFMVKELIHKAKTGDQRFREIMAVVKPDVVVIDFMAQNPALMNQGKVQN